MLPTPVAACRTRPWRTAEARLQSNWRPCSYSAMLKPCVLYTMLGVTESLLWVEANPGVLLSALLLSCSSCVLTAES